MNDLLSGVGEVVEKICEIHSARFSGSQIICFVDYDGTLVPLGTVPDDVRLGKSARERVKSFFKHPMLRFVVVSGRPKTFLSHEIASLNIDIGGEHGAIFYNAEKQLWIPRIPEEEVTWIEEIQGVFQEYSRDLPGSFPERKEFSVAWHYRNVRDGSEEQVFSKVQDLQERIANAGNLESVTHILRGKKVVEVRRRGVDKGEFVDWYLRNQSVAENSFFVAVGDDETDEDMFRAVLRRGGVAVRVGDGDTVAQYRLKAPTDVYSFFEGLVNFEGIGGGLSTN